MSVCIYVLDGDYHMGSISIHIHMWTMVTNEAKLVYHLKFVYI